MGIKDSYRGKGKKDASLYKGYGVEKGKGKGKGKGKDEEEEKEKGMGKGKGKRKRDTKERGRWAQTAKRNKGSFVRKKIKERKIPGS